MSEEKGPLVLPAGTQNTPPVGDTGLVDISTSLRGFRQGSRTCWPGVPVYGHRPLSKRSKSLLSGGIELISTGVSLRGFQQGEQNVLTWGLVQRNTVLPINAQYYPYRNATRLVDIGASLRGFWRRSKMYWPGALYQLGLLSAATQNHLYRTHGHQLFSLVPHSIPVTALRTSVRNVCKKLSWVWHEERLPKKLWKH